MLLEIQDYTSKEVDVSHQKLEEGTVNGDPVEKGPGMAGNGRPVFTITPPPSTNCTEAETVSPKEIVVGIEGSETSPKRQPNGMRSRDSRESLIPDDHKETWLTILGQVCIPFLIAGLGMVGAGIILDHVQVSMDRV